MSSEHSATIHTTPFEHTADNKLHFVPVDLAREKKNILHNEMNEIKMRKPKNTMARSDSSVERRQQRRRRQRWIHKNTYFFSPFFGTEHHVKHETVSCSVSHFGSLNTSATFKSHIVINHLWKITTNFLFRAHTKRTLKNHSHFLSYMCVCVFLLLLFSFTLR